MRITHHVFAIVLILSLIIIPVSAELEIQKTDDGKTLFRNGSYWILWDSIGNHTVGESFFVNATTNLPSGTEIIYQFYDPSRQCRTKICNYELSATNGNVTLDSKDQTVVHPISFLVNTTDFYASDDYLFTFDVVSPKNTYGATMLIGGEVYGLIELSPTSAIISNHPPPHLVIFAGICGSILILVYVFSLRRRKTLQRRNK